MSMNFGKLNFAVGFNRTSAFPLDANSYFENYNEAVTAAAGAAEVGSADSAYYIGQLLIVKDTTEGVGLYQINAGKTLTKFGQASSADELASKISALEARCAVIEGKLILATTEKDGFMSKEDKAKLDGIAEGAQANVLEGVKVDGTELEIVDKKVNIDLSSYAKKTEVEAVQSVANAAMPKAGGEFTGAVTIQAPTEDMNPATKKYVDDAISGITEFEFSVVDELPVTGEKGIVYLVAHSHGGQDIYDEYIWVTDKFEKIGNTDIDLSSYATNEKLAAEINKLTLAQVAVGAGKTLKTIQQENGKVIVELQDIAITQAQVEGLVDALAGKQAHSNNLDNFDALAGTGLVKKTADGYEVDNSAYITGAALDGYAKSADVTAEIGTAVSGAKAELESEINKKQSIIDADHKLSGSLIDGSVATAGVADSVRGVLTAGGKTYNGSEAVEITAADLGALTEIPQATAEALGGIKLGHTEGANEHAVVLDTEGKAYVTVPVPEALTYGVLSNGGLAINENREFSIAEGGVLTSMIGDGQVTDAKIAAVNVNKLFQTEGDELILNGGDAGVKA